MTDTATNPPMKALVVDDESTNRLVLNKLLCRLGYEVVEAVNGQEAIENFQRQSPDIVFVDVMMPVMNGYEATSKIKELSEGDFIPVIILTALTGSEELQKSIDAGADDFLSKPFDMNTLKSKIRSMERIRELYRHLRMFNQQLQKDKQFADKVFSQAIQSKNDYNDAINSWFNKKEQFNSDVFLTSYTPSQGLYVLFGHFNMHGTSAAVGALPTSETFRSMTNKGFSPADIIDAINKKLYTLLPDDYHLHAVFLSINYEVNMLSYANFGMPDCFIFSTQEKSVKQYLNSNSIALGDSPKLKSENYFTNVTLTPDKHIVLANLIGENTNSHEIAKPIEWQPVMMKAINHDNLIFGILDEFNNHSDYHLNTEQLSLIDIRCAESLTPELTSQEFDLDLEAKHQIDELKTDDFIKFDFEVKNTQLKHVDPIPILLNFIDSITNIDNHQDSLFTILTELYVNALDHGVLKLDSDLKSSPEGFFEYFKEKENRLESLNGGSIKIQILLQQEDNNCQLDIRFTDSGEGFDYQKVLQATESKNHFSGRGYLLIKNLCDKLEFTSPGNSVRVIYSWQQTSI